MILLLGMYQSKNQASVLLPWLLEEEEGRGGEEEEGETFLEASFRLGKVVELLVGVGRGWARYWLLRIGESSC